MKTRVITRVIVLLVVLASSINLYAQEADTATEELTKKQKRELRKQEVEAQNFENFENGKIALENGNWVLQADKLYDKYGRWINSNPMLNFVSLEDSTVYLQLSFPHSTGPNGLGGVTYKGIPTKITMKENKDGDITYKISVLGTVLNADITVRMNAGNNNADAQVIMLTQSGRIRFSGELVPLEESSAYRSRSDW